jgi:hypothetical protein
MKRSRAQRPPVGISPTLAPRQGGEKPCVLGVILVLASIYSVSRTARS